MSDAGPRRSTADISATPAHSRRDAEECASPSRQRHVGADPVRRTTHTEPGEQSVHRSRQRMTPRPRCKLHRLVVDRRRRTPPPDSSCQPSTANLPCKDRYITPPRQSRATGPPRFGHGHGRAPGRVHGATSAPHGLRTPQLSFTSRPHKMFNCRAQEQLITTSPRNPARTSDCNAPPTPPCQRHILHGRPTRINYFANAVSRHLGTIVL